VLGERLLRQPPELGSAASCSLGDVRMLRSVRASVPSGQRRLERLAGLGHPDATGQQLGQQRVAQRD